MRITSHTAKLFALILLLAFSATLSQAIGIAVAVRGASGYGPEFPFGDCASGNVGSSPDNITGCEEFSGTTSILSFNGTDYTTTQFVFGATGVTGTIWNLIDLGVVGPNTTFTLPPLFALNDPGIFGCDAFFDGATSAIASDNSVLSTDCTGGLTDPALANIINNG